MKRPRITGEQMADYIRNDFDLLRMFPVRPCLIKELLLLPYGASDIIIQGIDAPILIKVSGSRDAMMKLLKHLDGTKSTEELKDLVPVKDQKDFFDLQAMFFWHGLLQDGPINPPEPGTEQLASFLGRYLSITRFNRSRDEALQRLKADRLAVLAPAAVAEELTEMLQASGLGAFLLISDTSKLSDFKASFMLVIDDGSATANAVLQFAYDTDTPCMQTTIGSAKTRIGPFILPKLTAGHECAAKQLPAIVPGTDRNDVLFWTAFSLQETLLLMARISMFSYCNSAIVHHHDTGGQPGTFQTLARLPGSKTSGLGHAKPLATNCSGFRAWKHHSGTRSQPKAFLAPATHLGHYAPQNLGGFLKPIPPEYGSSICALPDVWEIPATLPWLNNAPPQRVEFNANTVGNLLRFAVGHQKLPEMERRISPTGGGLKSAGFFLRTQTVEGIADGWYSYSPGEHALEAIQNLDVDGIAAALPPGAETQPIIIVVVAHLQRVRNKYQDFSYNVVHLDAGVATAYATLIADSFGWQIDHYPNVPNSPLAHSLGVDERDSHRIISNVFSARKQPAQLDTTANGDEESSLDDLVRWSRLIDPPAPVANGANGHHVNGWKDLAARSGANSFEEVLKSRRAIRFFKKQAIKATLVEELVRLGHGAKQRLISEGMLTIPFSIYVLRVLGDDGLASGAYETNPGPMSSWKCVASPLSAADLNRCLNQSGLAEAPLFIVMVADLEKTFHQYGAAGYRHLLNQCGFVLGQIWIAAHAAGLVGTAAGGVLDEGMHHTIEADGYTKASLIGFVAGEADHQMDNASRQGIFNGE